METLSHNDLLALNCAIGEIYSARDRESFLRVLFSSLQSLVPAEYCSCSEVSLNPTCFLKINYSSNDCLQVGLKHQEALNAHVREHPLHPVFMSDIVFKTTDYASINKFKKTAVYNEYYRHLDVETQMGLTIPASKHHVALVALNRNGRDFTERDQLLLTLLRPHLINSLRNALEFSQASLERDLLNRGAEAQGQGIALFQADGVVTCLSAFAGELFRKYFKKTVEAGEPLPKVLQQWFATEAEFIHQVERNLFVVEQEGVRLTIRRLRDAVTGEYILIMTETDQSFQLKKLHDYGLSQRQSQVLLWLARGKTNLEIATILNMGKRTVEKHLENVFTRLGVESRAAAVAMVRGEFGL